jgi:5-methyltetrahydropteroyltriglutamate--homocysteine methyltransferase
MMWAQLNGQAPDQEALERRLRAAVAELVRKQVAAGFDIVGDGEASKFSWNTYANERLSGLQKRSLPVGAPTPVGQDRLDFSRFFAEAEPDGATASSSRTLWAPPGTALDPLMHRTSWVCVGPLEYRGQELLQRDIANLKAAVAEFPARDAFMSALGPLTFAGAHPNEYYSSDEAYYFAVAEALRVEYRAITEAGLILQLDDLGLQSMYKTLVPRGGMAAYQKWAGMALEAFNFALDGIPEDRVRMHLCWGGFNHPHRDDPPLRDFAELLMKMRVQGYCIEAANPRHEHEWKVWRDVKLPGGKVLIPGFINTKTNVIDHPEGIADRIVRFAEIVGRENIIAGTDCGLRWRAHPEIAWAKAEALAEGARAATRTLWGLAASDEAQPPAGNGHTRRSGTSSDGSEIQSQLGSLRSA